MKLCNDCNMNMVENVKVEGQHPFELGVDGKSKIFLDIPTGENGKFLGLSLDKTIRTDLKARVCPKCGKVEMYVDIEKFN